MNPLNDAMPARALSARWVIQGELTLQTAMHVGGDAGERVDMAILRDPHSGNPLLPGTTFAGALRNALADHLGGYRAKETPDVARLFGVERGRDADEGSQSPLIIFDAVGTLPKKGGVEIRDGVAISPKTGTAEDHKKFDFEVLPAGTCFPVRVDLLVPASETRDAAAVAAEEQALLRWLSLALDAFSHGESAFGARRSRGLGRVKAVWAAKRFALDTQAGWLEWALSDHERPLAPNAPRASIRDTLAAAAPEGFEKLTLPSDQRSRATIDLHISVEHDILVRSPGLDPCGPDVSHLRSAGRPILPGTSLAGVMRAHALRIAGLVHGSSNAEHWVNRLFGPRFEGRRPRPGHKARASRLRISEAALDGAQPRRQARNAIDRFTQGAADTAFFEERVEIGGTAKLRLTLEDPHDGELGLVLLVLKDLLNGTLPIGGTSSVGRGVLHGYATVTWRKHSDASLRSARVEPGKPPSGEAGADIDEEIKTFLNVKAFPA